MEIISSQPFWYVFMGSMTVSRSPHRHLERSCLSVVEQRVLSARETLSPEISCRYAACTMGLKFLHSPTIEITGEKNGIHVIHVFLHSPFGIYEMLCFFSSIRSAFFMGRPPP